MAKPNIEINLSEKTISTDGRSLRLEDNFEGAGIFNIGNRDDELALELSYRKKQGFHEIEEQEKQGYFISWNRLKDIRKRKLGKGWEFTLILDDGIYHLINHSKFTENKDKVFEKLEKLRVKITSTPK